MFIQLLTLWSIADRGFETVHRLFQDHRTNNQDFVSFWKSPDAQPLKNRLTTRQRKMTRCSPRVIGRRHFTLDSFVFSRYRPHSKTDNSCVMVRYHDDDDADGVHRICYGRITNIFQHCLYNEEEAPSEIFFEADWYSKTGVDPITGLTRVRRNPNFDVCRLYQAKQVLMTSFEMWPASPFAGSGSTDELIVIENRGVDVESL